MWPFSKKPTAPPPLPKSNVLMKATSNDAFFEMQCQYGYTDIKSGKGIAAIVIDGTKDWGAPVAVKLEDDGTQLAMIKVASTSGGFVVPAKTAWKGAPLSVGDLVTWVPMTFSRQMKRVHKDWGWTGPIVAKIEPAEGPDWGANYKIVCEYFPPA